ncbi:ABC transporter ATP-binding protein [Oceanibium sediminis]|uniref:ABC transporter ATP-binding protein n=1 Tax=Oceanibium sediminis TaxID=2026339 RepID=UPI000DD4256B|nr:ABC transporter ATP-binding protein [Oceanibium sediminis]
MSDSPKPVLEVENLSVRFPSQRGEVAVVDGLSFQLRAGESLVIAGESGSGKSMACRTLLGITPDSSRVDADRLDWKGQGLLALDRAGWNALRGAEIAMIFQDPAAALNPLITVETLISDAIRQHRGGTRAEVRARTIEALSRAGFPEPEFRMKAFPGELSGGLRQRVAIALALSCEPSLIIADEATTNLDVSIQAQIVELLRFLQADLGLALIFVTHDLGLAREIGGDLMVMYAGQAVEYGRVPEVLEDPCHPYTRGLLRSAPTMASDRNTPLQPIPGTAPRPGEAAGGAPFRARCPVAMERLCERENPGWTRVSDTHRVACHRFAAEGRGGVQ